MVIKPVEERLPEERRKVRLDTKEIISIMEKEAPGLRSKEILKETLEFEAMSHNYFALYPCPPVIAGGKGALVWDVEGNEYIDLVSGASVNNFGYSHPKVTKAIKDQCEKLVHVGIHPNELRLELAKRLVKISPGKFKKKVNFTTGGGEAAEFSMTAARYYSGKAQIMAFYGCYHGTTYGAMSATCSALMRYYYTLPLNIGIFHVPYAYCYRCAYDKEYPECNMYCTRFIEELFRSGQYGHRDPEMNLNDTAAIIVEPLLGAHGYVVPPDEFLPELKRIAEEYGLLLIADEIQSGFGRSGRMWASELYGVEPDMLVIGKSLGGGIPLSATIAKEEIIDSMGPLGNVSTFAATPLACAAALAVLDVFEEEKLPEHAADIGRHFMEGFKDLAEEHEIVGNVTGKGLFIGVELVKDRKTKEPAKEENTLLQRKCMKRSLLYQKGGFYGNIIKIIPPLVINREEVDKSLEIFDETLKDIER